MKANELRIGNYVHGPLGELCVVKQLGIDKNPNFIEVEIVDGGIGCNGTSPIPITKEWLLRLGFKKVGNREEYVVFGLRICKTTENEFICPDYDRDIIVNHLHQLQNLYFALTGQELTIKETAK